MSVHIRPATQEDYGAILPIAYESQAKHADALPHIFQQGVAGLPEDYFLGLLKGDSSVVYVAEFEKSVVGYVLLEHKEVSYLDILIPQKVAFISDIAVLNSYQGKGVGRLLFQECVEWARSRGTASLELMVWEFNKDAIAFYERMGMQTANRTMALELS